MQFNLNINTPSDSESIIYDSLIIGAGPAGVSAAVYLKRKGHTIAIISDEEGGQVATTSSVENYPGFVSISGFDLTQSFMQQLNKLAVTHINSRVNGITKNDLFEVTLDSGQVLQSHTVLYAAGATRRKLGAPGEAQFAGRGVAYCSICDGPFFADRDVIVVGGGNSAVESVIDLAKIARHVTLVHRSTLKADQVAIDQMMKLENVTIRLSTVIDEIRGDQLVKDVILRDTSNDTTEEMPIDGIFIDIGSLPRSELAGQLVELNGRKEIVVDALGKTDLKGFYAAGDVTDEKYKQIVVAAGRGASAALAISDELNQRK